MACDNYITLATQYFASNPTALYGPIAKALATKVPYLSALKPGTFPNATAQQLQAPLQGRTYMYQSLAAPQFTAMLSSCGSCDIPTDKHGTQQYPYSLEIADGLSDKICLNRTFSAFLESLNTQLEAYQLGVTEVINADVRWQLYQRSGVKAVVQSATAPVSMITGGEYDIDTAVPAVQADAGLDFKTIHAFKRYMQSALRAVPFGSGASAHAKLIGSNDLLENLRDDLGAATGTVTGNVVPLGSLAAGGDKMAMDAIKGYLFEPLYRGIQFGEDPFPLRLNWNGAGYDPVEPNIAVAATNGTVAKVNPDWLDASHEVAFLMFDGSFERQVPAPWVGEGKAKFARQMFGGEIQFKNHPDMQANLWGDWGVMAYRIGRAYRPLRPWFVLPIIYKRCVGTTLSACSGVSA